VFNLHLVLEQTDKIIITASPRHQPDQEIRGARHVFSYSVTITNNSFETVQLLRRHWYITDGVFSEREVEGEGVIGQQPTLEPGESFEYQSWCPVSGGYGSMRGYFTFTELRTSKMLRAEIQTFLLMPEEALN
jgi:ApaG protein